MRQHNMPNFSRQNKIQPHYCYHHFRQNGEKNRTSPNFVRLGVINLILPLFQNTLNLIHNADGDNIDD